MSLLTAVTHNLPWFIRDSAVALIGTECYTILVYNLDLSSTACLRYSLSKVLGFGIVLGGSIVKVPQIIKIVRAGNARGVSLGSYLLDTAGLELVVGYNWRNGFPFSTYGENIFLLAQNLILSALIIAYSRHPQKHLFGPLLVVVPCLLLYLLTSPYFVPLSALRTAVAGSIPLSLASKVPQIVENARRGSTGQMSAFLVMNSLAGCLARVFTAAEETGDRTLWWSFVLAALLNGVLALQMALYWTHFDPEDLSHPKKSETKSDHLEEATVARYGYGYAMGASGNQARVVSGVAGSPRSAKGYVRKAD